MGIVLRQICVFIYSHLIESHVNKRGTYFTIVILCGELNSDISTYVSETYIKLSVFLTISL